MVKIKVLNKQFEIKAKYLDLDKPIWDDHLHNKFKISVKNLETNKTINFYFYDSLVNTKKGKTELTEEDLIYCFKMFLEDSLDYIQNTNIDDFAEEFGFTKISEAIRAFKGCKRQFEKCLKLGISEEELYDLLNCIIEHENEDKLLSLVVK